MLPRNDSHLALHEKWMRIALKEALKGKYSVSPNPTVGACVVKNNKLISLGYHARYGGPHAEVTALTKAGKRAKGATLYVTLEPCSCWGKTPPCVDAIIESGISQVVIGASDPNPKNGQKGIKALRKAGIKVQVGVLGEEAKQQLGAFEKWVKTGLPYVTLKMAQSLDGKIATKTGSSRWISSPHSRDYVHQLRSEHDAVMVGKNTLMKDDPRLSPMMKIKGVPATKPWRVVLDPDFTVSSKARVFEGEQLTFVAICQSKKIHKKGNPKASIILIREVKGRLDMKQLLEKLGALGVTKLLVEGGGETAATLIDQKLVDELIWIIAPKIIGGRNAITSVEGDGVSLPDHAILLKNVSVQKLGEDILVRGKI